MLHLVIITIIEALADRRVENVEVHSCQIFSLTVGDCASFASLIGSSMISKSAGRPVPPP
nr:MAG TPA: hypothetical protein [Caudoviricetes sp.]